MILDRFICPESASCDTLVRWVSLSLIVILMPRSALTFSYFREHEPCNFRLWKCPLASPIERRPLRLRSSALRSLSRQQLELSHLIFPPRSHQTVLPTHLHPLSKWDRRQVARAPDWLHQIEAETRVSKKHQKGRMHLLFIQVHP